MSTRVAAGPGSALAARDLLVRRGAREGGFELRVEALDLLAGGVLAVLGPNGAGKSTLLRTLAGLERPLRGRIERRVAGPVTMVFQRPIAFSGSVEHNVSAALSGLRLARVERRARVAEALEHFDIARLASRRGDAVVMVQCTQRVARDMVFIPFHYHECVNRLSLGLLDPHSRQPAYKQCAVRVEAVDDQAAAAGRNLAARAF